MPARAIYASRILTPQEEIADAVVVVEGSCITGVGHRDEVRIPAGAADYVATGLTLIPGFIDLHIHGAGGHDVMEANARALDRITSAVARFGTTSLVATTLSASAEETCRSLQGIARYIRARKNPEGISQPAAEILGIHLEGPFLNKTRRGAQPQEAIFKPSWDLLKEFLNAADGLVRILTLAPELPGALDLVRRAVSEGLLVALGHTDADYEQAREGIRAGARHAVHVFNAMRPFSHRDPGVLGAILTDPEITAEVIADGLHVAGPAIQILLATKGYGHVILASDATSATGMPDGNYKLGDVSITVREGVSRNAEGRLAGSTLTLDRAVRAMVALGVPLLEAVRMATLLPARRLGLAGKKGVIAAGADADLVVLTPDLRVAGVMTRGVGFN